ncbi:hypothetical protein G6F32_013834 [Rhizopus arrhizus]|nr:hypothetical protein G6F32_013834 [Rhizopus arrhizus]
MPALRVLSAFCSAAGAHNPPRIRSGRRLLLGDLVVRVLFRERLDVRAEVLADGFGILERLELLGAEVGVVVDRARAARIAAAALEAAGEGDGGGVAGQLAAAAVAACGVHQAGPVQLRQQAPAHHRMGRQARRQLFGGARCALADQVRHHVQGIGKRVRGLHVTTIVTFKSPVQSLLSFHMDTFVL